MKNLILIVSMLGASPVNADPIECLQESQNTIIVKMQSPHPKEALVHRPNGETVWLQVEGNLAHKQITNFENLEEWIINSRALGTVFKDGVAIEEPIFKEEGRYHLYIAENTETEKENTYFIECYFEITE